MPIIFGHPAKLRQCQTEYSVKIYSLKYYILNELWGENDLEMETRTERQNKVTGQSIQRVGKKRKNRVRAIFETTY